MKRLCSIFCTKAARRAGARASRCPSASMSERAPCWKPASKTRFNHFLIKNLNNEILFNLLQVQPQVQFGNGHRGHVRLRRQPPTPAVPQPGGSAWPDWFEQAGLETIQ